MLRRSVIVGVAAIACLAPIFVEVMPAVASAKATTVLLVIPNNRVAAGKSFAVNFSTTAAPGTARKYLQREFGSAKVWKSVMQLKGTAGSAMAPGVSIGKYLYRVLVVLPHEEIASPQKALFSYGNVPFETVCLSPKIENDGDCSTGDEQVGTTIFDYEGGFFGGSYPTYQEALNAPTTTCRQARLQFAERSSDGSYDTYVQFIQRKTDPQSATAGPDTIGSITAGLDGGPWILNVSADGGLDDVKITGTFNCYTTTGF